MGEGAAANFVSGWSAVPGVDLPAVKLELRPGFHIAMLADADNRTTLLEALAWFRTTAMEAADQAA